MTREIKFRAWDYMPITPECEVIGNIYENNDLLTKK